MKTITTFLISTYQVFVSPVVILLFGQSCRFEETCSQYTKRKIKEEGVVAGIKKGLKRLSACHPYGKMYTS